MTPVGVPPWSPASAPIWGLVCGLPSKTRGSRLMLMLKAFVDDSHSGHTGPVFVLAGYISTAEKWAAFTDRWQMLLDGPPKLEYFKMKEAFRLEDQFRGWSAPDRDERLTAMALAINDYAMEGMISIIPSEPYDRLFRGKFRDPMFDRPYFYSLYGIMVATIQYLSERKIDGRVDFIFDKGNDSEAKIYVSLRNL
jgi:hypothetical protein